MLFVVVSLYVIIIIVAANRCRKYSNDTAQQGRTKNIFWPLSGCPYNGPCMTLEHSLQCTCTASWNQLFAGFFSLEKIGWGFKTQEFGNFSVELSKVN